MPPDPLWDNGMKKMSFFTRCKKPYRYTGRGNLVEREARDPREINQQQAG